MILHNDPINGFAFVVDTLMKVFRYGGGKAFWLTLKAHTAGRTIVWSGCLEVAELKAEYNDGNPVRTALELRNPQGYPERVAKLKADITRQESDIAGIRRELDRLPAVN